MKTESEREQVRVFIVFLHSLTFKTGGQDYGQGTLTHSQVTDRANNQGISSNTSSSRNNISGPSNNTSVGAAKKRGQASVVTASVEGLQINNKPAKKVDAHTSKGTLNKSTTSVVGSKSNMRPGTSQGSLGPAKSGGGGSSVFDRLTDSSGYTGSHKERFNADGSGRGLAGRAPPAKGAGTTSQDGLAKILRT